ncbi:MAG: thioredoxin [Verrucomicrobiales bacterium]
MKTTTLNESNFDATIEASDKPVLVDFYADWCGPCQMLSPIIEEIADEQGDRAVVAKLNIDDARGIASRFGITSIPALIVFKGGQPVASANGMQSKDAISALIAGAA